MLCFDKKKTYQRLKTRCFHGFTEHLRKSDVSENRKAYKVDINNGLHERYC